MAVHLVNYIRVVPSLVFFPDSVLRSKRIRSMQICMYQKYELVLFFRHYFSYKYSLGRVQNKFVSINYWACECFSPFHKNKWLTMNNIYYPKTSRLVLFILFTTRNINVRISEIPSKLLD